MSAEDVEREHLETLGPELGPLYHQLYNECAWLQMKWAQYVELFGSTPERIDLLNRASGRLFSIVEEVLWQDTLLHLARLTDPPGSLGKANLTVQRLPALVPTELRIEIQELVDAAVRATEFVRDWRNRHIAHRDLALALHEGAKPLAAASRASTRQAIDAVCQVVVRTHLRLLGADLALHRPPSEPGGAESLLYVIRDGIEANEARMKRLRDGHPLPDDLTAPPII